MTAINSKYRVEKHQIDAYLKRVFINRATTFVIVVTLIMTMSVFTSYKQGEELPIWVWILTVAIATCAYLFGLKWWNDKLRKLAGTEFILTIDGIIQTTQNKVERNFKFSEIAVVQKKKHGTTIVKGNWLTKINFYRPKKFSPYQLCNSAIIFIPNITTNYSELIDNIKQAKRLS